ncbi:MAG: 2-amino-4-hydroxy-6-hydroxymethyldihydropteridine diphosphokinase [Bdellovibrionales bacterium]|nr:2-amino-4-hydroxy-6-hydroxymethyldihydropteridine diphosphokinase [Bdellovibrionales bacterium]
MQGASICYIGFGGNTGNPIQTFQHALALLADKLGSVGACSPLYKTKPLNPPELQDTSQPDFINMVAAFSTQLPPLSIMQELLNVEKLLGRDRNLELRWGPRTIDLDLLLMGDVVLTSETLTLPHPRMHERDFVLKPLNDIAPSITHPTLGLSVSALLEKLYTNDHQTFVLEALDLPAIQLSK